MGAGNLTLVTSLQAGCTSPGPGLCSETKASPDFLGKQLATLRRVRTGSL